MIQEVIYAIDRAAFNQGKNAKYNFSIDRGGQSPDYRSKRPRRGDGKKLARLKWSNTQ